MNITNIDAKARPRNAGCDLSVSNQGMTVIVAAGSALFGRVPFVLSEDFAVDLVSDPTHTTYATLYLVRAKADDAPSVVVDELVKDPNNPPMRYNFDDDACPYKVVHQFAYITILPGVTDLDAAPANVWRIVDQDSEPEA